MTLTTADRATLEFNNANYAKMTVRGLSDQLSERKVPGRSKAVTREAKIELLMSQCWGYQEYRAEKTTSVEIAPIAPVEIPKTVETSEAKASAELMAIDPQIAETSYPLMQWIECKKASPEAIVMVEDNTDNRCLLTYAGDATIVSRLLYLTKNEIWFGDHCFDSVRIDKTAFSILSSRLRDRGYRVICPIN